MRRPIFALVFAVIIGAASTVMAQLPSDLRSEQVFIAPENVYYLPGDTIRTEGIVTCMSNVNHAPYSRYVYVELITGGGSILARQKVSCDERGYFRTGIPTDSLATEGEYWVRSYTRLMRNFASESFAYQPVIVSRSMPGAYSGTTGHEEPVCIVSVPGGTLVAGSPQNIYAVVMAKDGSPLEGKKVVLTREGGDTLATALSSPSGYVAFTVMPEADARYCVNVEWDDKVKEFEVPCVDRDGVKVNGNLNGRRVSYDIAGNRREIRDLYLYDRHNGLSHIASPPSSGTVTLPEQPDMVTLFVAGDSCRILSELSVGRTPAQKGRIVMKQSVAGGEEIDFGFAGIDSDSAVFVMARVIPQSGVATVHADEALRYRADLRGELPFPARMYSSAPGVAASDLAAWLATARFDRFRLADVAGVEESDIYRYMPETVMELNGTAQRYQKYPVKKGSVVAYNGDSFMAYDVELTKSGRFSIPVDDFEEGCEFMLQYINTVGTPELVDLTLDNDSFPAVGALPRVATADSGRLRRSGLDADDVADISHQLGEVVVKARAHSEQNTSGRRFYATKMKDRETIERRSYRRLLDILRDMPMLRVRQNDKGDWIIQSTRSSATMGGPTLKHYFDKEKGRWEYGLTEGQTSGMALLVDGSRYDQEMFGLLMEMPADDIESVEQLSPYEALAYAAFAIDGAVMVTTRTAVKPGQRKSRGMLCRPMGLTMTPDREKRLAAPSTPGHYRLLVDVVTADGIHSLEQAFTVVE